MKTTLQKLFFVLFTIGVATLLFAGAGTLYRGKFVGGGFAPDFVGNAGGISNSVDLIPGDPSVLIVTGVNKRSFTITATSTNSATNVFRSTMGAGGVVINTNTYLYTFDLDTNIVSSINSTTATTATNLVAASSLTNPVLKNPVFKTLNDADDVVVTNRGSGLSFNSTSDPWEGSVFITNGVAAPHFYGEGSGITNLNGTNVAGYVPKAVAAIWATNAPDGYGVASTNYVLQQVSSVGTHIYSSAVTNAVALTNIADGGGWRTNIWWGSNTVVAAATTNTVPTMAANAYVRNIKSSQTFNRIADGPISVNAYIWRDNSRTVSLHPEFYWVENGTNLVEFASGVGQTVSGTVPTLMQWAPSAAATNLPTAAPIVWAWRIDASGGSGNLYFGAGGALDSHATLVQNIADVNVGWNQITDIPAPVASVATNNGASLTNISGLTAGVTNQWRIDATNAAAAAPGGFTNYSIAGGVVSIHGLNTLPSYQISSNEVAVGYGNFGGGPNNILWSRLATGKTIITDPFFTNASITLSTNGGLSLTGSVSFASSIPSMTVSNLTVPETLDANVISNNSTYVGTLYTGITNADALGTGASGELQASTAAGYSFTYNTSVSNLATTSPIYTNTIRTVRSTNDLFLTTWLFLSGQTNYLSLHWDTIFRQGAVGATTLLSSNASQDGLSAQWVLSNGSPVINLTGGLTNEAGNVEIKALETAWLTNAFTASGVSFDAITNISGYDIFGWYVPDAAYTAGYLTNLITWNFQPADLTNSAANNSPVLQSAALDGKDVLWFPGTNNWLQANDFSTNQTCEVIMLTSLTNSGATAYLLSFSDSSSASWVLRTDSTNMLESVGGGGELAEAGQSLTNEWVVLDVVWTPDAMAIYTNNICAASNAATYASDWNRLFVGGRYNLSSWKNFTIAEMATWSTNLGALNAVGAYATGPRSNAVYNMATRYGISLP